MGESLISDALANIIGAFVGGGLLQSLSAELSALNSSIDKLRAGVGELGSFFASSLKEASGYEDAVASLDGMLQSTNITMRLSREALLGVAKELGQTTKFSDETAISAEKVMLTFTKVGSQVFPEAMRVSGVLSMALGQDLQSSVIQVGKALSNPVRAIRDLAEAGVYFDEGEKENIKKAIEFNNVEELQNIVLAKLKQQYGEAAKAAGGNFSSQLAILKNSFSDLLQTLGSTFLPLLKDLLQWVNEKIMPAFKKWAEEHAPALRQALRDLADWLQEHLLPAVEGFVKLVIAHWPRVQKLIEESWVAIKPQLEIMGDMFQLLGSILNFLAGVAQRVTDAVMLAWSVPDAIRAGVTEFLAAIGKAISDAVSAIQQIDFLALGLNMVHGLIDGVMSLGQEFIDALVGIINDAVNAIIQWLGIASPSKVFMEIGAQMVAGLVDAITTKAAEISTAMGNAISGAVSAITSRVADFFSAAAKLVLGENQDGNGGIVGGIRTMALQIATEMSNAISGAKDAIAAKIGEFFDAAKALIVGVDGKGETGLVGGIRSMALQIATEMGSAIRCAVTAITDMVGQFYDAAVVLVLGPKKDGGGGIVKGITDKVEDIKTAITTAIGGAADLLATLPKDILDKLATVGTAVIDGILSKTADMGRTLADAFKGAIKNALEAIRQVLGSSENPFAQGVINQINAAINAIEAALGIASPSKVFAKIGSEMVAGLAEGFATPPLSATLADGTMAMGLATSNAIYNQQHYYNLTIHSNAQTEQVVADFAMLRALAGA